MHEEPEQDVKNKKKLRLYVRDKCTRAIRRRRNSRLRVNPEAEVKRKEQNLKNLVLFSYFVS